MKSLAIQIFVGILLEKKMTLLVKCEVIHQQVFMPFYTSF